MKKTLCVIAGLMWMLALTPVLDAAPWPAPPKQSMRPVEPAALDLIAMFDANNLNMVVTNVGNFGYDIGGFYGKNDGLYYPARDPSKSDNTSVIYAGGLWVGALVNNEIRIAAAEYSRDYTPGPMIGSAPAPDQPRFKVYKIRRGNTTSDDYLNWPVQDGAPVDEDGKPLLIGDQTMWCVYNDANAANHAMGQTLPLGIEVQQTTFGFSRTGPLGNCVFIKFLIINKGNNTLQDTYVSVWADPDLGGASDDLVGCDVNLSLGYCYNATNADNAYKSNPPAVGYDFFQGPIVPSEGDTAYVSGRPVPDYRNLPMTSFNKYINGTDPDNFTEIYNYMKGLLPDGSPLVNEVTGQVTTYFVDGDPVTGTGWLDNTPADRRYMQSSGPFTMVPGDTQEVVIGIIVGQGTDRLTSITALKFNDQFAQTAFDLNFDLPQPPAPPVVQVEVQNQEVILSWGLESELNPGDFPFQGYNVWQSQDGNTWRRIATFDVIDGAAVIFDDQFDLESGVVVNKPVQFGTDSGIKRYYSTKEDKIRGGPLRNVSAYFYAVTAYSYDPNATPKTLENPQSETRIRVIPQRPVPENTFPTTSAERLPDARTAGGSDGHVEGFVIHPSEVTGHTYEVTFEEDGEGGFVWNVRNLDTDSVIVVENANQTGDNDYPIFDGIQIKVFGAPNGLKTGGPVTGEPEDEWGWDIPSGTRRFTWAGGADGLHFEAFLGAIGWASPASVFGSGIPGVPPGNLRKVLLKLADVSTDGTYDPNDPNVSYAYRYGRGFSGPPARPEFEPFIVNPVGGYSFQDFTKSVPLSAWDVTTGTPRRLEVGHLENNVEGGMVDGKWWPPDFNVGDNVDGGGPREWLFVFNTTYEESPNPAHAVEAIGNPLPIMYFLTVARRGEVPFTTGDEFLIIPNFVNTPLDTFRVMTPEPVIGDLNAAKNKLDRIRVVPNPFYNNGPYDPGQNDHLVKFQNLPGTCTIRIFNLMGELITTIQKDDPNTSLAEWNMLTDANLPVAPGVYLYMVEAPGIGTHFGKMAIFLEKEQLNTF